MSIISANYRVTQGEHGLAVIEVSGRATASESATLRSGVVTRFQLVPFPAAKGAMMKMLDGSRVEDVRLTDSTGTTYHCVKIYADVNPLAPTQATGWPYAGSKIVRYLLRYQQVGRIS